MQAVNMYCNSWKWWHDVKNVG